MSYTTPLPLFDTLDYFKTQELIIDTTPLPFAIKDFKCAKKFLMQYSDNDETFSSYRSEVERLLQWSWLIHEQSILTLKSDDIETYIKFCINPPKSWINIKRVNKFVTRDGIRVPNTKWTPFVVSTTSKNTKPDKNQYSLSQSAIQKIFRILSSFYHYLVIEKIIETNPVALIRQKSKFIRKQQDKPQILRLSELQWDYVIETAEIMSKKDADRYGRTLFIMSALYLMYLRISELVATDRWLPQMKHFYQDGTGNWWFKTVGKGNKERHIAVSDKMLEALKAWRKHLDLSPLPSPKDNSPILPKLKGKGGITSTRQVRKIVQECFDAAQNRLIEDGFKDDAEALDQATVHWLRHTGISDDINKRHRPIAHVRDDAGHSSAAITDRYNDIDMQERHKSAQKKSLKS